MKFLLFLLFLTPVLGWAQQEKTLELSGTVKGLPVQSIVYIVNVNQPNDTLAVTKVRDGGKFMLKASLPEPNLHHLTFVGIQQKTLLFVGNDKIKLEGSVDDLKNIKVTGSESQKDFVAFQTQFNPIFEKLTKSTQPNSGVTFSSSEFEALQKKLDSFIVANKNSYVAPFVMVVTAQLTEDINVTEKRYQSLDENVQQGYFGKYVKQMIDDSKVGAIGSDAIDFTQNDVNDKPISLSSFKGKYVLVDFWASWCGPCRKENPYVVKTFDKFKNKNFTILGVSLDRQKDAWVDAIAKDKLTWTNVSDLQFWNNAAAQLYKVQSIPQNFLIDPNGKIVARDLRGAELEKKLCEYLGCAN